MIRLDCLFVFVATFQIISCQDFENGPPAPRPPPDWANHKCARPPPGVSNPRACCPMEPLFTDEEMANCGIPKFREDAPPPPPDCDKQECLLKTLDALNEDKSVNYKTVQEKLYAWASEDWKPAVDSAIGLCMGENGVPGPKQICEAHRLMFCVGVAVFNKCPKWQQTDECVRLKQHMDECNAIPPPPIKDF